ncbi:cysteine hydrolase [Luteibacter flocculans]|uniref:Cysteine hydrolase n=1 Tax=Luteibacter flocculans TaxID=2780091 RepID=A0ABY4SXT4_9GAMM|nr:isochorismatase family cysteine hydrolase [Luteibacter flocculans]URL56869.1 cysteine hydrolase [Luteibacter flocculans]
MSEADSRTALLVLDVFNTFQFPGGDELFQQAQEAIGKIRLLRERFHAREAPVIFVNDNFDRWQDSFDELVDYVAGSGAPGRTMVEALCPHGSDLKLLKPRHSAFFETALPSLLDHFDVRRIVVTGLAGDSCVLCTVLDAHVRGITPIVPADTTASQTIERTTRALAHLRETFGTETPLSERVDPH